MKIVFKDTFVTRLERQIRYIAQDNPTAAKKFKKGIIFQISKIPFSPYIYRRSIYFDDDLIRDLVYKGYTIVFKICEHQIEVFGFVKFQENIAD